MTTEQEFLAKAASVAARRQEPELPVAVAEAAPPELGTERTATCQCGQSFTQVRMTTKWLPEQCKACSGVALESLNAHEKAQAETRVAALEVPALYRGVTLESFALHGDSEAKGRQQRLTTMARRYLTLWPDVPAVVVFRGGPGSGKGHIAWSLVKGLVRLHPVTARVVKLGDTIRDLREAWRGEGGPSEAERLKKYRTADLLVIDEVSRHAFYGEPHRHLYDLIDHRVEAMRPTILTTNETMADFREILGPAVTSRVAGTGYWEFGDTDYRLRKAA